MKYVLDYFNQLYITPPHFENFCQPIANTQLHTIHYDRIWNKRGGGGGEGTFIFFRKITTQDIFISALFQSQ